MKISSFYFPNKKNKDIFNSTNKYMTLCIYSCIAIFLLFAKSNLSVMSNVTSIFIWTIIPSLFPFILFNNVLINSNYYSYISNSKLVYILSKLFKTNIYGATSVVIGFTIGFPNSARYLNEMYVKKYISKEESKRLMLFVNNPSPVFLVSAVGIGMFGNISIGIVLVISYIISSILTSIISYIFSKDREINFVSNNSDSNPTAISFNTITKSILDTFISLAYIFGFMAIFSILFSIIGIVFSIDNKVFSSILNGLFEISMRNKSNIRSKHIANYLCMFG